MTDYYQRGRVDSYTLKEVGELIKEDRIYLGGAWLIDNTEVERESWICRESRSNDLNNGICRRHTV